MSWFNELDLNKIPYMKHHPEKYKDDRWGHCVPDKAILLYKSVEAYNILLRTGQFLTCNNIKQPPQICRIEFIRGKDGKYYCVDIDADNTSCFTEALYCNTIYKLNATPDDESNIVYDYIHDTQAIVKMFAKYKNIGILTNSKFATDYYSGQYLYNLLKQYRSDVCFVDLGHNDLSFKCGVLRSGDTIIETAYRLYPARGYDDDSIFSWLNDIGKRSLSTTFINNMSCSMLEAKTIFTCADGDMFPATYDRDAIVYNKIKYPVVIKPIYGKDSTGVGKYFNKEEVESAFESPLKKSNALNKCIAQDYIEQEKANVARIDEGYINYNVFMVNGKPLRNIFLRFSHDELCKESEWLPEAYCNNITYDWEDIFKEFIDFSV